MSAHNGKKIPAMFSPQECSEFFLFFRQMSFGQIYFQAQKSEWIKHSQAGAKWERGVILEWF